MGTSAAKSRQWWRPLGRTAVWLALFAVVVWLGYIGLEALFFGHQGPRIAFYGRVIDRSGQPLAEIKATIEVYQRVRRIPFWDTGGVPTKTLTSTVTTDADGRFEVRGVRGVELRVSFMTADGFANVNDPRNTPRPFCFDRDYIRATVRSCPVYQSDPDRPAVFVVRRM